MLTFILVTVNVVLLLLAAVAFLADRRYDASMWITLSIAFNTLFTALSLLNK